MLTPFLNILNNEPIIANNASIALSGHVQQHFGKDYSVQNLEGKLDTGVPHLQYYQVEEYLSNICLNILGKHWIVPNYVTFAVFFERFFADVGFIKRLVFIVTAFY